MKICSSFISFQWCMICIILIESLKTTTNCMQNTEFILYAKSRIYTAMGSSLTRSEKFTRIFRVVQLVRVVRAEIICMKIVCMASSYPNWLLPRAIDNDMTLLILQGASMPHLIKLSKQILKCFMPALYSILCISKINLKLLGIWENIEHEKVASNHYVSSAISFAKSDKRFKNTTQELVGKMRS